MVPSLLNCAMTLNALNLSTCDPLSLEYGTKELIALLLHDVHDDLRNWHLLAISVTHYAVRLSSSPIKRRQIWHNSNTKLRCVLMARHMYYT